MKIKNPLMSIDARGRYALALVYSIWRGLNYARTFVVPTNPQTGRQLTVRGFLTTAVRAWAGLTQAQRDNWNDESKDVKTTDVFGDNVIISGINYYTALSTIAQDLGEVPVSDPPTAKPPKNVDTVVIATGALSGEVLVTWDGASEILLTFGLQVRWDPAGRRRSPTIPITASRRSPRLPWRSMA